MRRKGKILKEMQKQKQKTNKQIIRERKHDEEGTHPSEAITGSLMISCEIGQMNSGGQSDGTHGTTHSLDGDLEELSATGTSENQNINKQQQKKTTHVVDEQN